MKNKKFLFMLMGVLLINFLIINNLEIKMFADSALMGATCHEPGVIKAFRILAYVITFFKILAPIFIIVTGIVSGLKLVIEEADGGAKKLTSLIIQKICVAAFIFFIPGIVGAVMKFVNQYDKTASKFTDCGACLTSVSKCDSLLSQYDK